MPDPYRHVLRDALLVTLLALVTVGLATLGKPFMEIPGVVDGSAHAVRKVNLHLFGGFETASVWYGGWSDLFGNILLFMPFGAAVYVVGRSLRRIRWGLGGALLAGLMVSLGIETAQYVFSLGFSDIDDVLYNTVGSVLGALLMARLSREERMKILQRLGFLLALAAVALSGAMLLN
ncbi:putative integral membrane protein [Corynebacterium minutissimum]|uniref:Putative integral membrane protein n=1 Tax=Corynebacterium minutissimum TaxID=38301 RepID=A0A2X4RLL0_9CORY|nr:putative integral membrane protein [Corynebacterium minutissimum]VEG04631.1 putative integral membrane protein [Corynebacterium minutissimum]